MENMLHLFEFQENKVRVIEKDGEPWWVAKDVCETFGDTNYRRSMSRLDDDEKGVSHIDTTGGKQAMTIINESGLYALLFNMEPQKSAKQSNETVKRIERIKNFRRWVTHEVLPSIRKYGAYITPQKLEEVLMNPDAMTKIIQNFIKLQQKGEP